MNYYTNENCINKINTIKETYFKNVDLSNPSEIKELNDGYFVNVYTVLNELELFSKYDKEYSLCRLYKDNKFLHEWINIGASTLHLNIFKHSNGHKYLIYNIDLYGYSVLELDTLKNINYLPYESYNYGADFEETFIFCDAHYNEYNDCLAVDGCFWSAPYSIMLLDFKEPLKIIEANKWIDINDVIEKGQYYNIDFESFNKDDITCIFEQTSKGYDFKETFSIKKLMSHKR